MQWNGNWTFDTKDCAVTIALGGGVSSILYLSAGAGLLEGVSQGAPQYASTVQAKKAWASACTQATLTGSYQVSTVLPLPGNKYQAILAKDTIIPNSLNFRAHLYSSLFGEIRVNGTYNIYSNCTIKRTIPDQTIVAVLAADKSAYYIETSSQLADIGIARPSQ
jgi:hypothetical protein